MANHWQNELLARMFSPIPRSEALRIASHALAMDARNDALTCFDTMPPNCRIYKATSESCWYIYVRRDDGKDGLAIRSSRVILVGKQTGTIHYDGSAGDEG